MYISMTNWIKHLARDTHTQLQMNENKQKKTIELLCLFLAAIST